MKGENQETESGLAEFENAVEKTGFGLYNLMLLMLGGGTIMTVIVDTMAMAYVLPAAQCDMNLSITDKSIISSISFLGIVFSSLLWGFLADLYGRRKVMVIAVSVSCCFGFLSSIVPYVWMFIICRFINGFFAGCPASVTIAYVGEFHSEKYRGKVISWTGAFVAIGSLYLPGFSWLILPMQWEFLIPGLNIMMRPWRLLIIMFSLPSFIIALFYIRFPETPKFLWSVGKSEESLAILRDMYHVNTRKPKSLFPVAKFEANSCTKPDKFVSDDSPKSFWKLSILIAKTIWDQMMPLFKYPLLKNVMLTSFLQFGIQAGAQGVFMWVPEIFNRVAFFASEFPDESVTVCKAFDNQTIPLFSNFSEVVDKVDEATCSDTVNEGVFMVTLIFGFVYTFVFVLIGFIVNIVGKKLLLVIIIIITSSGGALINSMQSLEAIIICLGMYLMMGPCMNIVFSVQVDLFPTQYRAKAVAISQILGRFGAVTGSSLVGFLLGWNCISVFYTFSSVYLGLIFLSMMLPIPLFVRKRKT